MLYRRSDEECDEAVAGDGEMKKRNKVFQTPWRSTIASDLMKHTAFNQKGITKERYKSNNYTDCHIVGTRQLPYSLVCWAACLFYSECTVKATDWSKSDYTC
jgi:hypothetical protein